MPQLPPLEADFDLKLQRVLSQPKPEVVLRSQQLFESYDEMHEILFNLGPGPHSDMPHLDVQHPDFHHKLEALLIQNPQLALCERGWLTRLNLLSGAAIRGQGAMVELLLRYGAKFYTEEVFFCADADADELGETGSMPFLVLLISVGYDYRLVAKCIKKDAPELPYLGRGVYPSFNLEEQYNLRAIPNGNSDEVIKQVYAAARAFSSYYHALRKYYIERGTFLKVCNSKQSDETPVEAKKIGGCEGNKALIFSFLRPAKEPFQEMARAAVATEVAKVAGRRYITL